MYSANRNRHPADHNRKRVFSTKYAPMGNGDLGALIDAKGAQTLAFFRCDCRPIYGYNPGRRTAFESFEFHPAALPERKRNCN